MNATTEIDVDREIRKAFMASPPGDDPLGLSWRLNDLALRLLSEARTIREGTAQLEAKTARIVEDTEAVRRRAAFRAERSERGVQDGRPFSLVAVDRRCTLA